MGQKPKGWNWSIQFLSDGDYLLEMSTEVEGRLLGKALEASKKKLADKRGLKVGGDLHNIQRFELAEQYFKVVLLGLKRWLRQIRRDCRDDGDILLSERITKGEFTRVKDKWEVSIKIRGIYAHN